MSLHLYQVFLTFDLWTLERLSRNPILRLQYNVLACLSLQTPRLRCWQKASGFLCSLKFNPLADKRHLIRAKLSETPRRSYDRAKVCWFVAAEIMAHWSETPSKKIRPVCSGMLCLIPLHGSGVCVWVWVCVCTYTV